MVIWSQCKCALTCEHTHSQREREQNITSTSSFPNVFLSRAYFVASSRALWASPTAPAATYNINIAWSKHCHQPHGTWLDPLCGEGQEWHHAGGRRELGLLFLWQGWERSSVQSACLAFSRPWIYPHCHAINKWTNKWAHSLEKSFVFNQGAFHAHMLSVQQNARQSTINRNSQGRGKLSRNLAENLLASAKSVSILSSKRSWTIHRTSNNLSTITKNAATTHIQCQNESTHWKLQTKGPTNMISLL